ncbi:MAG: hypothetical protein WC815_13370 [Vicinamibacterales bacterium]|jgi:hypothetical protein
MDILLTLLSSGLQALIAYWGYKLTVDPIETPRQRRWYRAGFITIGVVGVALTVTQQWMNGREQAELLSKIDVLGTGVEQVRSQTQQPPTVTVNVPPIQVLPAAATPSSGPLPTFRLTDHQWPIALNDVPWHPIGGGFGGYQVRLDWNELAGIDAYAELEVWARDCGKYGAARVRIFDVTSNSAAIEGPWVNPTPVEDGGNDMLRCPVVPQRLKLPRAKGMHVYVLQGSSESDVGLTTARGEIVLERQRK